MSRSSHRVDAPSRGGIVINASRIICAFIVCLVAVTSTVNTSPVTTDELHQLDNETSVSVSPVSSENSTNSTQNDLYVIRAVVYEIGILTDADNSTNATTDRHEEVGISIYDPPHKEDGLLDLSGIPLPLVVSPTGVATQENNSTSDIPDV